MARTSSQPPHIQVNFAFVGLFLMCSFPTGEHLRGHSGCPFHTKAVKEILSSGAAMEDASGGGKGWDSSQASG